MTFWFWKKNKKYKEKTKQEMVSHFHTDPQNDSKMFFSLILKKIKKTTHFHHMQAQKHILLLLL